MFFIKHLKNFKQKQRYRIVKKYKLYRLYEIQCILSKPIDRVDAYLYDKEIDLILLELEYIESKIKELKC